MSIEFPTPSQTFDLQSPFVCIGSGVPGATGVVSQSALLQAAVRQSLPGQSAEVLHMPPALLVLAEELLLASPPWPPTPPFPAAHAATATMSGTRTESRCAFRIARDVSMGRCG
jgi:hypothetical protein